MFCRLLMTFLRADIEQYTFVGCFDFSFGFARYEIFVVKPIDRNAEKRVDFLPHLSVTPIVVASRYVYYRTERFFGGVRE